CAGGGGDLDVW
nr:immunoglobulin heavy chain junction region [Macaca mulatta]